MATQAERRILHITTDKLENLNDTQIAFEDFRDEGGGLSYFGGAFGGRYDNNAGTWGTNISRFARYNSTPIFQRLVFDTDVNQTSDSVITLTTAPELTHNHSGGGSSTTYATVDDIGKRADNSVNIGYRAGQIDPITGGGLYSVNIGHLTGYLGSNFRGVIIGSDTGVGASITQSAVIGYNCASNASMTNSVAIGSVVRVNGQGMVGIGWETDMNNSGVNAVAIGTRVNKNGGSLAESVVMGVEARHSASGNSYRDIIMGFQAGYRNTLESAYNIYLGAEAATKANSIFTVALGVHAGGTTQSDPNTTTSVGNVFLGWECGDTVTPVTNPYREQFSWGGVTQDHNGFNIGIGGLALEGLIGATNIGIGYGAGGMSQGNNFQNISLGVWAGQNGSGDNKIAIGTNAGFNVNGDHCVHIGMNTGFTSWNDSYLTNEELGTGEDYSFELGMNPIPQYNSVVSPSPVGNTKMRGLLLSGNFNEGWIWANNMFGMAPLDQDWVDSFSGVVRKGHMVYNNTENKPQYYDGSSWVSLGGAGVSTFTGLNDTPANYTGANDRLVQVNSSQTGLTFGPKVFSSGEQNGHILQFVGASNSYVNQAPDFTRASSYTQGGILMQVQDKDAGGYQLGQSPLVFNFSTGIFETSQKFNYTGSVAFTANDYVTKTYVDTEVAGAKKVTPYITGGSSTSLTLDYNNGDFQQWTSTQTGVVVINVPTNMTDGAACVIKYIKPSGSGEVRFSTGASTKVLIEASASGSFIFSVTRLAFGNYVVTQASELLF